MRVISSELDHCVVLYNDALYEIKDDFSISTEQFLELKQQLKLRNVTSINGKQILKISDILNILENKENIRNPELISNIQKHYNLTLQELSKKKEYNTKIIINGNRTCISEVIKSPGTTLCKNNKWRLLKLIGLGRESAVFIAKNIKRLPFEDEKKILKLPVYNTLDTSIRNIAVSHDGDNLSTKYAAIENMPAILDLAYAIDVEKSHFNKACGLKSKAVRGLGLLEEIVPGQTLTQYLEKKPNISIKKFEIFIKIFLELQKLHSKNITHNDLNSNNVMIQSENDQINVRLIDFSFAQNNYVKLRLSESTISANNSDIVMKKSGKSFKFTCSKPRAIKFSALKDYQSLVSICQDLGFNSDEFDRISTQYHKKPKVIADNLAFEMAKQVLQSIQEKYPKEINFFTNLLKIECAQNFWKEFNKSKKSIKNKILKSEIDHLIKIHKTIYMTTKSSKYRKAESIFNASIAVSAVDVSVQAISSLTGSRVCLSKSNFLVLNIFITSVLAILITGSLGTLYLYDKKRRKQPKSGDLARRSSHVFHELENEALSHHELEHEPQG